MNPRSATFKIVYTLAVGIAYLVFAVNMEAKRVDQLPMKAIDLTKTADGTYKGGFVYQNQIIQVIVTTVDHSVRDIQIVRNINGESYTKGAESLVSDILRTQKLEVPNNSKETVPQRAAKKAILLAIERALSGTPLPSDNKRSPWSKPAFLMFIAFLGGCASLGAQLAGYIAFRSGNTGPATIWVWVEDFVIWTAFICGILAIFLAFA